MYCIKCGTDNPSEAAFCKACGASMKVELPDENVPVSTQPLDSASVLDYNNPEPPNEAVPVPELHYESRCTAVETGTGSHPRSYSPSYTSPSPAVYAPPVYVPYHMSYGPHLYAAPAYTYRTVAVPTYEYRTVAVPTYTVPWYVVPTWKFGY